MCFADDIIGNVQRIGDGWLQNETTNLRFLSDQSQKYVGK